MAAEFEVRITPLMRGIPGELERDPSGATHIEEEDTILVEQFADLEVVHELNEFRTGKVTLSIHDPIVEDLEPYQFAVWIAYKRPLETLPEAILYGKANVITDFDAETVTLEIQDPSLGLQHHYIRRGDEALNVDKNRGRLEAHASSITPIIEAARNIPEQQDRGVPVLGLYDAHDYYTADIADASFIDFDRGQECWDLVQQIARSVGGPDFDIHPRWFWPTEGYYAYLWTYDPADPPDPSDTALARNLDPADADDPDPGEVVFDYGLGQDNLSNLTETPGRPTTHAHVLDEPAVYRETSADADASYDTGVFVDWIAAGFAIRRPTRDQPVADTTPLRAIGDAHIKAYGRPPKHLTLTLRPDDALGFHYGHPEWIFSAGEGALGGEWYIGDFVRVRGLKGERSTNELARITGATFSTSGWNGLPWVDVRCIPAVGGVPGDDLEEGASPTSTGGGEGATPGEGDGTTVGGGGSTGLVLPSGEAMPDTDLTGWRLIFTEDFDVDVALGDFPADMSADWTAYPNYYPDTSDNGTYDPERTISVHDGMLDKWIHSEVVGSTMRHLVAAPIPRLPADDPSVLSWTTSNGQPRSAQLYGRYSVRFRADDIDRYKTAWLLWPKTGSNLTYGEIDFPEGDLSAGSTIHGYMHRTSASSGGDQASVDSGETYTGWHTATIEWTPGRVKFIMDGVTILNTTERVPSTPMIWVLQTETQLSDGSPEPDDLTEGHVCIDWVAVWAYDP